MYETNFSIENLIAAYEIVKKKKLTTGIDRVNRKKFEAEYKSIFANTSNKLLNRSFKPTPYKEVLIIKDSTSFPRKLSLPTIRDKTILEILKRELMNGYNPRYPQQKVADIINAISEEIKSNKFTGFIKLDIKGYYDNINHDILLERVANSVNDEKTLALIKSFIENITIPDAQLKSKRAPINTKGVPQGISISNILGNIYLEPLDDIYYSKPNLKYFRYVDDIIVLCDSKEKEDISKELIEIINSDQFSLDISETKKEIRELDSFEFLGYSFNSEGKIGIAKKNILKIEQAIEKIFSDYLSLHDKRIKGNIKLLQWKINFRITGCFRNNRRYGWVIFFCQNQDETIFHHLDDLVVKICKRYKLDDFLITNDKYIGKKFVKTYYEFINKQNNTDYIPNVDNFTDSQKRDILINVCRREPSRVNNLNEFMLNREFDNFIFESIRDIERDLYQIYT